MQHARLLGELLLSALAVFGLYSWLRGALLAGRVGQERLLIWPDGLDGDSALSLFSALDALSFFEGKSVALLTPDGAENQQLVAALRRRGVRVLVLRRKRKRKEG